MPPIIKAKGEETGRRYREALYLKRVRDGKIDNEPNKEKTIP